MQRIQTHIIEGSESQTLLLKHSSELRLCLRLLEIGSSVSEGQSMSIPYDFHFISLFNLNSWPAG